MPALFSHDQGLLVGLVRAWRLVRISEGYFTKTAL